MPHMTVPMPDAERKLLLFADDRDVAEVAAFGLRMHGGWEPVIATTASQASKLARDEKVAAIAFVVVQPSSKVVRTISRLIDISNELGIPLLGITPDRSIGEQFALLGVEVSCTPFDPISMWSHLAAIA